MMTNKERGREINKKILLHLYEVGKSQLNDMYKNIDLVDSKQELTYHVQFLKRREFVKSVGKHTIKGTKFFQKKTYTLTKSGESLLKHRGFI